MLRNLLLIFTVLLPAYSFAEMVVVEKGSYTINGVKKDYVLEVDVADIDMASKIDPTKDKLPMSINEAINIALSAYKEKYKSEPWGISSVSFNHFPSRDHKDHWHFKVNIFGDPNANMVVLLNEKVVFPRIQ